MNGELIKNYATCGIDKAILNSEINALTDVGNDNISSIMEGLFGTKWTYEITKEEIVEINNVYYIMVTIALHTTIKSMTGISTRVFNGIIDRELAVKEALVDAFNNTIQRQHLKANIVLNNETVKEVVEKTNDEIQEEPNKVEQTDISNCEEELNTISASSLMDLEEEMKNSKPPVENNGGIRKDQVEFLNLFKEKHNIDNDKKFNYYVKVWSDTTSYEIQNKRELASAGASIIDEFIKWVQEIVIDRVESREIVSPI